MATLRSTETILFKCVIVLLMFGDAFSKRYDAKQYQQLLEASRDYVDQHAPSVNGIRSHNMLTVHKNEFNTRSRTNARGSSANQAAGLRHDAHQEGQFLRHFKPVSLLFLQQSKRFDVSTTTAQERERNLERFSSSPTVNAYGTKMTHDVMTKRDDGNGSWVWVPAQGMVYVTSHGSSAVGQSQSKQSKVLRYG